MKQNNGINLMKNINAHHVTFKTGERVLVGAPVNLAGTIKEFRKPPGLSQDYGILPMVEYDNGQKGFVFNNVKMEKEVE